MLQPVTITVPTNVVFASVILERLGDIVNAMLTKLTSCRSIRLWDALNRTVPLDRNVLEGELAFVDGVSANPEVLWRISMATTASATTSLANDTWENCAAVKPTASAIAACATVNPVGLDPIAHARHLLRVVTPLTS